MTIPESTDSSAARNSAKRRLPVALAVVYYLIAAILVGALVVAQSYATRYADLINVYLGTSSQRVVAAEGEDAEYFTSEFASDEERENYLTEVATDISREGITLIQNDGGLPLAAGARVSLLGQNSVDPVTGGVGAGSVDGSGAGTFADAFAAAGLEVNPVAWDFYATGAGSEYRKTTPDVYGVGAYSVNEVPQSVYTSEVTDSFADYADAGIVMLGRSGGETADLRSTTDDDGTTYLQLSTDEQALIDMAVSQFDTVVVVLNASNPVELGYLAEAGVDATLWVGSLGVTGTTAVAEVIAGEVNPSGALVDTYAYDSLSSPAMANFGSYSIANNAEAFSQNAYLAYAEGIYVGYRYYETRYEDVVLGNEDGAAYDYAATVQYPFGHGLSYTEFSWSDYAFAEVDGGFEMTVTVTNDGDVTGKDVVQAYVQQPYTDYDREQGIEKPAVELAGYAKTGAIEPGASETVTVEISDEVLRVYDADGYGTFIADAGDYFFSVADDAHAALNNILAAKGFGAADGMTAEGDADAVETVTLDDVDTDTYSVTATGATVENQFADADLRTWDEGFTYLSRADWQGTWPTTYADGAWEAPEEFIKALQIAAPTDEDAESPTFDTIDEEFGEITAAMLVGEDYDNPLWETLLDQASFEELEQLVRVGGYATRGVDSIQLPATVAKDGPAGFSDTLVGGESGQAYPPAIVLASSWNDELAREFGNAIGEDSLDIESAGWYAPSMNIHRTPYSGRNFEYFSEDGLISGQMGAEIVVAAQAKGVTPYVKHFAVNDQETNRIGGAMFANEQSIRDLYLLPFEITVEGGNAHAMMAAMNRIGPDWVGAHEGLMTDVLRGEWGFEGAVITDQASFDVFAYEDLRMGLDAGTDLWLNTDGELWRIPDAEVDATYESNVRDAAHHIAFAVVNSNAMNGLSAGATIESVTPWWQWALYALDVVVILGAAAIVFFTTRRLVRDRRGASTEATA